MEQRFDRASFKAVRTDDGFIKDTPVVTRTGVLPYRNKDGSMRYELRHPDDVFRADSLDSIVGKPITAMHRGLITKDNAQGNVIGTVLGKGRQDGSDVIADIVIHDTRFVDDGNKELSCCYTLDLVNEDGVYEWVNEKGETESKPYTHRQVNIKYNHLAVVPVGRAGNSRLNLDAADLVENEESMTKIRLDSGQDAEVTAEVATEIQKLRQDSADVKSKAEAEKARYDALADELKEAKDKIEQVRQDTAKHVKARIELEAHAKEVQVTFNQDASDNDIKTAIIKSHRKSFNADGKSDEYIQAAYELVREDAVDANEAVKSQRQDASNKVDAPKSSEQVRKEQIEKGKL